MRIVKSYNKQNDVTYVYEVLEHTYDKEKKFTRSKRRLIGKIDPQTGDIVPTGTRGRKNKTDEPVGPDGKIDYQLRYLEAKTELKRVSEENEKLKAQNEWLQKQYDLLTEGLRSLLEQSQKDGSKEISTKHTCQVPVYSVD
ncbi:hypothetical protein [Allobaculum sp. JKK-2023]|uniref:hypothetical protein n=1 Tax=Allobaculum sp. JKK-2023 TaxID=3108943 RepID=UPI002B05FDBB|nr:hypothetical protein [Allobaculum sp. JKK-2023]